ncbi:MAG: TPM domain-containing protein [Clostridia bacterium]|nr:TPM domain-containing protein [Clostridia bacterium]
MKKLLTFIVCTLLIFSLGFTVLAYEYDYSGSVRESLIYDFAQLISDEDEEILLSKLEEISKTYECEVAILTVNSTNGQDITIFADDYYDYNGFGYGENDDGIMLVVDMGNREFATTTHGTAIEIFSDYNLSLLENEFIPYLSDSDYTGAFIAFQEKCNDIFFDYNYNSVNDDYNYNVDDDYYYEDDYYYNDYKPNEPSNQFFSIKWILVAIVIGIIIGFIYTGYLKSQLKTVRSKAAASDYVVAGSFNITQQRDVFMYRNIKKTPKPKANNTSGNSTGRSSGGSSTHRSSSGRTHGGSRGRF